MFKKSKCPFCNVEITVDTNDKYGQCEVCGNIYHISG